MSACRPVLFPPQHVFFFFFFRLRQSGSLCAPRRSAKSSLEYVMKPAGVLETIDNATQESGVHEDDSKDIKNSSCSLLQPPAFLSLLRSQLSAQRRHKIHYNWLPINPVWLLICHPLACWWLCFVDLQMAMFYYYHYKYIYLYIYILLFFLMRGYLN